MNKKTLILLDRTFNFGVNTLKFLRKLTDDAIYKFVKLQVSRSAVSVGANHEEAQGAVSKRDFTNKFGISYKEARESLYWLRILQELYHEKKFNRQIMEITLTIFPFTFSKIKVCSMVMHCYSPFPNLPFPFSINYNLFHS